MELAKRHTDKLKKIKQNIKSWHDYFEKNAKCYHAFLRFVFDTSLTNEDINKLKILQKPIVEFNILEAMLSKLLGEFSKQEPSLMVRASDAVKTEELTPEFIELLEIVESHMREILLSSSTDHLGWNLFKYALAGGYSVAEVYTEYMNERSFDQVIKAQMVFDSTLAGFDPLARESHKGDGEYCFKLVPYDREEFEAVWGKEVTKEMKFHRTLGDFSWSYENGDQEVILVGDYYEKVKKREKIVKLSNGHVVTKANYDKLISVWEEWGAIEQPPVIIEERYSMFETIHKYIICDTAVLEHHETSYRYLPLVFVDGNSVDIQNSENGATYQMTRPYLYHAMGVQKLKNFSGQTVAAEIENLVQHKFKVSLEAIPEEYKGAYKNVQQADVLVYNAFYKDNPEVPLPPPMEIQRTPTPPIVENTFMGTDRVTQTILGSYDSLLGTNAQQVSGVAIQQGAMQTNAAAIPYLMGYINGLNRIGQIILDLIPKYYVTPRSIPVKTPDGKRAYQMINDPNNPDSVKMSYDSNNLQIKIEPGVNSAVQKQVALEQITRMMQSSETFANFINTKGLETIVDNLDIRGVDHMKEQAAEFMKEQAEAAKQPPQPDPLVEANREQVQANLQIEQAKVEQRMAEAEGDQAIKAAELAIQQEKVDIEWIKAMAQVEDSNRKAALEDKKTDAEIARAAVEVAMEVAREHNSRME